MTRALAILGSIGFFFLAPGTIAGLMPWWISRWLFQPPFLATEETRLAGIALFVACLAALIDSFARFAIEGLGTPAPVAPPQHLIVTGQYRYVRNPMYVAVVGMILGQALFFADEQLLLYAAGMWLAFSAFVIVYEEPVLLHTFGAEYANYRAHVGRWLPRLRPWHPN